MRLGLSWEGGGRESREFAARAARASLLPSVPHPVLDFVKTPLRLTVSAPFGDCVCAAGWREAESGALGGRDGTDNGPA